MQLFGLIESVNIKSIFITLWDKLIPVRHLNLFSHLEQYDTNFSVGLEIFSEEGEIDFPPLKFKEQKIHLDLIEYFRSRGNPYYFLEQEEYFKQMVPLAERLSELERQLKHMKDPDEQEALELQMDPIGIELNYMNMLGREQPILEHILRYKPDLVFLGDAHAVRFYNRREELARKGIEIEGYWREEFVKQITEEDLMFAASASSEHMPMEIYLEGCAEVELEKVEEPRLPEDTRSIQLERLYKTIKEGRVTDGNPNFIGTWNPKLPHRGLFEVFVDEVRPSGVSTYVKGTIEDCLGSAQFGGYMQGESIIFVKEYTHAVDEAMKVPIQYEAERIGDGEYEGYYLSDDGNKHPFNMNKLKPFEIIS